MSFRFIVIYFETISQDEWQYKSLRPDDDYIEV